MNYIVIHASSSLLYSYFLCLVVRFCVAVFFPGIFIPIMCIYSHQFVVASSLSVVCSFVPCFCPYFVFLCLRKTVFEFTVCLPSPAFWVHIRAATLSFMTEVADEEEDMVKI